MGIHLGKPQVNSSRSGLNEYTVKDIINKKIKNLKAKNKNKNKRKPNANENGNANNQGEPDLQEKLHALMEEQGLNADDEGDVRKFAEAAGFDIDDEEQAAQFQEAIAQAGGGKRKRNNTRRRRT